MTVNMDSQCSPQEFWKGYWGYRGMPSPNCLYFLGRRQCLRHREQTIPVPSSVVVIQGKSFFHDGSIPVRLVFDGGLLELEDDLRFDISHTRGPN